MQCFRPRPSPTTWRHLGLSADGFSDGIKWMRKTPKQIKSVILTADLTEKKVDAITKAISKCSELYEITILFDATSSILRAALVCTKIRTLDLRLGGPNFHVVRIAAQFFSECPNLASFSIKYSLLDAERMAVLCAGMHHAKNLVHLDLSYSGIDDDGIECLVAVLPRMERLVHLDLMYNPFASAQGLAEALTKCPKIQSVLVYGNPINTWSSLCLLYTYAASRTLTHLELGGEFEFPCQGIPESNLRIFLSCRFPWRFKRYFDILWERRIVFDKINSMGVPTRRTVVGRFLMGDGDTAVMSRVATMLL